MDDIVVSCGMRFMSRNKKKFFFLDFVIVNVCLYIEINNDLIFVLRLCNIYKKGLGIS